MDNGTAITEVSDAVACGRSTGGAASRLAVLVFLAIGVIMLDQFTKHRMVALLSEQRTLAVISGFFNLTLVYNRGAAFGLFAGIESDTLRFVLLGASAALAFIVVLVALLQDIKLRYSLLGHVAMGLVIGGAIGNLIDRVSLGSVVDFLDFFVGTWHWPAFNVADVAISVGVGILIVLQLWPRRAQAS